MTKTLAAVMTDPAARKDRTSACDLREIALPDLELDSALLKVELSEVCGTDVHLRDGRLAGVPYEGSASVQFKLSKDRSSGQISGRAAR